MTDQPQDTFSLTPAGAQAKIDAMSAALAGHPPSISPQTPAQARALLAQRSADPDFLRELEAGNADTKKEFARLTELIAQADPAADAIAGIDPQDIVNTTIEGEISQRATLSATADLRDAGIPDGAIEELLTGRPVSAAEVKFTKKFQAMRHGDPKWVERLLSGDYEARRELTLMTIILNSEVADPSA